MKTFAAMTAVSQVNAICEHATTEISQSPFEQSDEFFHFQSPLNAAGCDNPVGMVFVQCPQKDELRFVGGNCEIFVSVSEAMKLHMGGHRMEPYRRHSNTQRDHLGWLPLNQKTIHWVSYNDPLYSESESEVGSVEIELHDTTRKVATLGAQLVKGWSQTTDDAQIGINAIESMKGFLAPYGSMAEVQSKNPMEFIESFQEFVGAVIHSVISSSPDSEICGYVFGEFDKVSEENDFNDIIRFLPTGTQCSNMQSKVEQKCAEFGVETQSDTVVASLDFFALLKIVDEHPYCTPANVQDRIEEICGEAATKFANRFLIEDITEEEVIDLSLRTSMCASGESLMQYMNTVAGAADGGSASD